MRRAKTLPGILACTAFFALSLYADGLMAGVAKESVLYRFKGGRDGGAPMASMVADSSGNLYGTTSGGGGSANCTSGCGTVFELSPPVHQAGKWTETVLYSFQGGNDGATPEAPLILDQSGNLYGVTSAGGGECDNPNFVSCGTVFELMRPRHAGRAWVETLLYSFLGNRQGNGNGDLAWPNGVVFDGAGNLYGLAYNGGHCTTDETGTYCGGGAFSLTLQSGAWAETVLYRFKGQNGNPAGPVLDSAGRLYGTQPGGNGCGEVFRLGASKSRAEWKEFTLYSFQCGNDGAFPLPGLVFDASGNLYDTSIGAFGNYGNVFELSPTKGGQWSESVLHNFAVVADGYVPSVGPILGRNGNVYGTTQEGGQSDRGVVFELTPPTMQGQDWAESVLYSFGGGRDGGAPYGGLTVGKGNAVYGTTPAGGDGYGVIFTVVP